MISQAHSTAPRTKQAGVTLIEILIAVSLLSALTLAMLFAMRIGLSTFSKASDKLMNDRRVAGAQRVLLAELEGMMPVMAPCAGNASDALQTIPFFQGAPQSMRIVSSFTLQQAWRGQPHILEFAVIPGEEGKGVRLIVNEVLYTGPVSAGRTCEGFVLNPVTNSMAPQFAPVRAMPESFVLADRLAYCRISYLTPAAQPSLPQEWKPEWVYNGWPAGIRVEMAPLAADSMRLEPITVTAAMHIHRGPQIRYGDQ